MLIYWNNISNLHEHANKAVNKKIQDIVYPETVQKYYANPKNKGWIGNSIESDWFGLPNNTRHEADFVDLGVELKVTPIRRTKNGWSSKERLVLNIFDFNDEYKRQFENASFLEKANLMEIMFYEFIKDVPSPELFIKAATLFNLHDLPEEDMLIIKQDWEIIINKIKEGKAEELSDSLTKYLGATTKGSKSEKNMTTQPFSEKKAHRRSFTLKGSYMSEVVRKIMNGKFESDFQYNRNDETNVMIAEKIAPYPVEERAIPDFNELRTKSFEDIILDQFRPFLGKTKVELGKMFGVKIPKKNDKASTPILAKKMLNLQGDIQDTIEFKKAGIAVKTITVNTATRSKVKKTTEGFKLQNYFNFHELVNEDWDNSELNDYLSSSRFMFVVFEETKNEEIFKGVKFWSIPLSDLEGQVKETWERTKKIIQLGVELTYKPINKATATGKEYQVLNNLPKMKDDTILHVRPDAKVSSYKLNDNKNAMELPTKSFWINKPAGVSANELSDSFMTKQAFWLNPNYMYQQVKEFFEK